LFLGRLRAPPDGFNNPPDTRDRPGERFWEIVEGERRLPACSCRQPAGNIHSVSLRELFQTQSRQAAETCRLAACAPQSAAVKKAADGVTQTFPIDRLGEVGGETGGFGGSDVAVGSESAERDSIYLTGIAQLAHQIQTAAIG